MDFKNFVAEAAKKKYDSSAEFEKDWDEVGIASGAIEAVIDEPAFSDYCTITDQNFHTNLKARFVKLKNAAVALDKAIEAFDKELRKAE